jgi:hypothetical protein
MRHVSIAVQVAVQALREALHRYRFLTAKRVRIVNGRFEVVK